MIIPDNRFWRFFIKKEKLPLEIKIPNYGPSFKLPRFLKNEKSFLFLVLSLFLLISCYKLNEIPGLSDDEASPGIIARNAILGYEIPPIIVPYSGPISYYITSAFFIIFGESVFSLRLVSVFCFSVALIFSYLFVKKMFDENTAKITIFLESLCPSTIIFSRFGGFPTALVVLAISIILFLSIHWYEKRKVKFLLISSFIMGFGFASHMIFLYFMFSLLLTTTIMKIDFFRIGKKNVIFFFVIFFVSSMPYSIYILSEDHWIQNSFGNLLVSSSVVTDFFMFISGDDGFNICDYSTINYFIPIFFLLSLIIFIVISLIKWRKSKELFIVILFFVLFLELFLTISRHSYLHFLILWPLPFLLMGYSLSIIVRHANISVILIFLLVVMNIFTIMDYYSCLETTGGNGGFSTRINDLISYLDRVNPQSIISINFGLHHNMDFFGFENFNGNILRLVLNERDYSDLINLRNSFENFSLYIYPFGIENECTKSGLSFICFNSTEKRFFDILGLYNKTAMIEREFYSYDGKLVYKIYRVK